MEISFLIISYGTKYIENCVKSIRNYYEYSIYIVDNNLSQYAAENRFDKDYKNIYYTTNIGNYYELGAICHGVQTFKNLGKIIVLHDSTILTGILPEEIFKHDYVPFFEANVTDYSPLVSFVENRLACMNISMKHNVEWKSVCGCMCIIDSKIIKNLINIGLDINVYGKNKNEAVGTEILLGYLLNVHMKLISKPLHKYPIYYYFNNSIDEGLYIKKIGSGNGNSENSLLVHDLTKNRDFDDIFKNTIFTNIHNKQQCWENP